jgi:hypothetical protein
MKNLMFPLLAFVAIGLGGCAGLPGIEKAQSNFSRRHPEATVRGASEQTTNGFRAQLHFYYLNPGDNREHEDIWYYHHVVEGWIYDGQQTIR